MLQSSKTDFLRNKQLAWVALHKLKATWRSTLAMATEAWLFRCLVLSIFLAGAEAWVVGTELRADEIGAYTCMVRYVKGIKVYSRDTRVKNSELMVGFPRIGAVLQEKRLRFAAHCMRSD
ncbi:hypothetical protein DIPPA_34526 [Diplonema papillatum]|nr:hypothetical protein DIPPA_34526 [Diplonema papillatum]